MQKLQALHRILFALAKELEEATAAYNEGAHQVFVEAFGLVQPIPMNLPELENQRWQMLIQPGISLKIQEGSLVVDCNLILKSSGKEDIVIESLPRFHISLADPNGYCLSVVKKLCQEFTEATKDKQKKAVNPPYRSLAEFKFFLSRLV